MARRHRTRRARGGKRRLSRKQRRQRGGAVPTGIDDWRTALEPIRSQFKDTVDSRRGSEPVVYTFANLKQGELTLPPKRRADEASPTEVESTWNLEGIPYETKDVRDIGTSIRGFLSQYIDGGDVSNFTEATFTNMVSQLRADIGGDGEKTLLMLTDVETALRGGTGVSTDIDGTANYPLYTWYLVMNVEGEPVPLLEKVQEVEIAA